MSLGGVELSISPAILVGRASCPSFTDRPQDVVTSGNRIIRGPFATLRQRQVRFARHIQRDERPICALKGHSNETPGFIQGNGGFKTVSIKS